jgi:hypothetical protein
MDPSRGMKVMEAEQVIVFVVFASLAVGFGILAHRQAAALGLPAVAVSLVGGATVALVAPRLTK